MKKYIIHTILMFGFLTAVSQDTAVLFKPVEYPAGFSARKQSQH